MAKARSWWKMKQVSHRDAVILSVLSSSCLLAGEVADQHILQLYQEYLVGVSDNPALFLWNLALVLLAYTTYFGGIMVLLGGIHFSWGRVDRGRFLVSFGIGISFLGLLKQLASSILVQGTPMSVILSLTASLTGLGILLGFFSHLLMGGYALMLKKHARSMWRRWRRSRRPSRRGTRS
ncbi:MAG: hypothetical protein AABX97_07500 [Candidatus Thermoplasmatota archaeon]